MSLRTIHEALVDAGLVTAVDGSLPAEVSLVTDDSRRVVMGALFVAVRGSTADGHDYLEAAERAGAAAAIVETSGRTTLPAIRVSDGRRAAAVAAAAFHGWPAKALRMLGVTGTSGKSTTVAMLRHLFDAPAGSSASIGTLGVVRGSAGADVSDIDGLTTPGPVELQGVLRQLAMAGVRTVSMEVSSHALAQQRVGTVSFDAAVYTNLSHEHLDYHKSMEAYLAAKARLTEMLAPNGVVVINADEPAWRDLPATPRRISFGMHTSADVSARDATFGPRGSRWTLVTPDAEAEVALPLLGDFNVMNALGAAATAWTLGIPTSMVAERLASVQQVPGRLERIWSRPTVLRDYAHKPDALARALDAVRPFVTSHKRIITVVGCGGDRDRAKRPVMGRIAQEKSDLVIITSDNPRTEDPESILDEMAAGMTGTAYERIEDRREAIARALRVADEEDVVVLAGKGHETYQIRGTTKYHFDEREIVQELMRGKEQGVTSEGRGA
ncbi:MAG TPA: UDP-N-acetylmuramoyl-L-alanyl-D-glutamate--2,6-diaminopimelate ligase [Gemmatimonadaceae bacterium]|nr:UDP-N-acetylmuramoyl-L-alanyl-D-glutamate--2,6-diaminopimelate ligase [Gemmatimonadaceae bacterium]